MFSKLTRYRLSESHASTSLKFQLQLSSDKNVGRDRLLSPIIITDRHPNPLFSVCIMSPNAERKIMQTNCVRKTGAVFFGGREIIRGNLTRAKSTRSIIEACCIIKT